MSDPAACQWCERPFPARRGGSPQRFCRSSCRIAFWSALRRWGERAVAAGMLSLVGLLLALLDLPGDVWPDLAAALPEEVFDRIDRYMEARLT